KVLTVPVSARSLVQCWFSRDRDVEKLRKALEKKAVIFSTQKAECSGCCQRETEGSFCWRSKKSAILSAVGRDRWFAVLRGNGSAIYARREAHAAPPQCCRVRGKELCMERRTRPAPGFRVLFQVGHQREIAPDSRLPL